MKPFYENEYGKLYCGDCLDVLPQLADAGSVVSSVVTSPPYNVGKDYEHENDTLRHEYLIRGMLRYSYRVLDGGGHMILNTNDRLVSSEYRSGINPAWPTVDDECVKSGYELYDRRIWAKDPAWMRDRWHACSCRAIDEYEYLFVYRKPGASRRVLSIVKRLAKARDDAGLSNKQLDAFMGFNGMAGHWTLMSQPEVPSEDNWARLRELLKINDAQLDKDIAKENVRIRSRLQPDEWTEWGSRGIWHIRSVRANDIHPAMFPIELPTRLIRLYSDEGDVILDPFSGSGTTLLAAQAV